MDGQELWAQNYCSICDRLIEPGSGIAANGQRVDQQLESAAAELKKKMDNTAAFAVMPGLTRSNSNGSTNGTTRRASGGAPVAAGGGLKRSANSATRVNALSELRPTTSTAGPGRHHTRTASGGVGNGASRRSAASSRDSSRERARKSPAMSRQNSRRSSGTKGEKDKEIDSPPPLRSGIATPSGTGSGIARSQEEKRMRKEASEGLLVAADTSSASGATGVGAAPLSPLILMRQEQMEDAKAKAPAALYCSRACRDLDEMRSRVITSQIQQQQQQQLQQQLEYTSSSYGAHAGGAWPGPSSFESGSWQHQLQRGSTGVGLGSSASVSTHGTGTGSGTGTRSKASAGAYGYGYGPAAATSAAGSTPAPGTSWGRTGTSLGSGGGGGGVVYSYGYGGAGSSFPYPYGGPPTSGGSGSGGYPYGGYPLANSTSAVATPPELECNCVDCQVAYARAVAAAGRSESRQGARRSATPASSVYGAGGGLAPGNAANSNAKAKARANAMIAGTLMTSSNNAADQQDNVSAVPSGASDTTESSGGYPYGPGAVRTKKRTTSGRVETPLDLQPGQASHGDYFAGADQQQHSNHHNQYGLTGTHHQQHGSNSTQRLPALGIGSASTNGTEDSTLSYWESRPRTSRLRNKTETLADHEGGDASKAASPSDRTSPDSRVPFRYVASPADGLSGNGANGTSRGRGLGDAAGSSFGADAVRSSPLRLLKRGDVPPHVATSPPAVVAGIAPASASLSTASGFLSRSLTSEHTELGTSATTTGTFNMGRSSTIRDRRTHSRTRMSGFGHGHGHGDEPPLEEEGAAWHLRSEGSGVQATPAVAIIGGGEDEAKGSMSYNSQRRESVSSAMDSLRIAQALGGLSHTASSGSLSRLWGSGVSASGSGSGTIGRRKASISTASDYDGQQQLSPEQDRNSRRWSMQSDASAAAAASAEPFSTSSSSNAGWWRSLVPAWASIKALQALSHSAESDDEQQPRRPEIGSYRHARAASDVVPSTVVKPATRRDEVPDYAKEVGNGAIPGEGHGRSSSLTFAQSPAEEQLLAKRNKRRMERERAQKIQRSKDAHTLPPLLAPSRSQSNLNLRRSHTPVSAVAPSPLYGSFGAQRSTTPGPGMQRSTTPNIPPPSPGLRAIRSPNRASYSNLPTLGEAMMRPPSRNGSAMGMHGSLGTSPRRVGLGWNQIPTFTDAGRVTVTNTTPLVHHPHAVRHHHGHHPSQHSVDGSTPASYEETGMDRPPSAAGHRPRPRSNYGSYGGNMSAEPSTAGGAIMPSQLPLPLQRAASSEPQRTWSYERMPGLKTYPVMQLPNRRPAHDIYDVGWSDVLTQTSVTEDPAAEEKAVADENPPETVRPTDTHHRKKLFFFDS